MERLTERFLRYVRIETTSSEETDCCPSTPGQFDLARLLVSELRELGIENAFMAENCFVYGHIVSNLDNEAAKVGFLAHMDTSNAASGKNVSPRIIEDYDGKDIVLNDTLTTSLKEFPQLKDYRGKSLIVTDGTTLLGGDDKAGIAIIMEYAAWLQSHPEVRHGDIYICFTPDEEIGAGIDHIDLKFFPVDYAYTMDGGSPREMTYECFNAATAVCQFTGVSIHPGSAKNRMINACELAMEFHALLPVNEKPQFTEGREGFNHLEYVEGTCAEAKSVYIIRNHDSAILERQKGDFRRAERFLNEKYGRKVAEVTITDAYRNMKEGFTGREYIIDNALNALRKNGLEPIITPMRGGTDGAKLTVMGVPTPNLGTGDMFCHGNHEIVCIEEMRTMVEVLKTLTNIIYG